MKKKTHLPRYKTDWNIWKEVDSPGPFYYGGGLHYVNKEGNFVHAGKKEMLKDIKSRIMTKIEFKKMFGHLLNQKLNFKPHYQKLKQVKNPKLDQIPLTDDEIRDFKWELAGAILYGAPDYLCNAITITKIGKYCTDHETPMSYDLCSCEWCPDCKFNRCICNLNLKPASYQRSIQEENKNKVRRAAWKLAKKTLNKNQLIAFRNNVLETTGGVMHLKEQLEEIMKINTHFS